MGRFVAWLGDFSLERQKLWLPKDDLQDSASWSSSPLVLLRDIQNGLLAHYDCKDTAPPQSHSDTGARVGRSQQDGDVQQQEADPLRLPQITRLHGTYRVWGEDASTEHDHNAVTAPGDHAVEISLTSLYPPRSSGPRSHMLSTQTPASG